MCVCVSVCVCVCLGGYFFVPFGKFDSLYLAKAQQPQEQRYPLLSVCAVFLCVQTMVWLPSVWDFNIRLYVVACDCRRGLCDTVRESALEVDPGGKQSLAAPGTSKPVSITPVFSDGRSTS